MWINCDTCKLLQICGLFADLQICGLIATNCDTCKLLWICKLFAIFANFCRFVNYLQICELFVDLQIICRFADYLWICELIYAIRFLKSTIGRFQKLFADTNFKSNPWESSVTEKIISPSETSDLDIIIIITTKEIPIMLKSDNSFSKSLIEEKNELRKH